MALTIELPTNIEKRLRKNATQKGIAPETYLLQLLENVVGLRTKQRKLPSETELLQKINLNITEAEWVAYKQLIDLRKSEQLTTQEHEKLLTLSDKIEKANVNRLQYLIALAKIRHIGLEQLMNDVGIIPI